MILPLQKHPNNIHESRWGYAAILMAMFGLFIATFKIATPYSFWADELYSVTASNGNFRLLNEILLNDVHPPLYQTFLMGWINLFGDSEFSTRSLSWLFAVSSIYPMLNFAKKHGSYFLICSLTVLSTNSLFTLYANETRSYAMALFLATLVSTQYLSNNSKRPSLVFLACCLALSLTHYFGLILTAVFLAFCLFDNRNHVIDSIKIFSTGILALAWPIYHLVFGSLIHKTGGSFWIKVDGMLDSFGIAASAITSRFGALGGILFLVGLLVALATAFYGKRIKHSLPDDIYNITIKTVLLVFFFSLTTASIDLVAPMSTTKNYIVLLPLLVILLSSFIQSISMIYPEYKNACIASVFIFSAACSAVSLKHINDKASAQQDWKGAALYLSQTVNHENIYALQGDANDHPQNEIFNFYLQKISKGKLFAKAYTSKAEVQTPAFILYGHFQLENLGQEMKALGAARVFPPTGIIKNTGVYFISEKPAY